MNSTSQKEQIKFSDLNTEIREYLQENNISLSRLRHRYSDLYIGCNNYTEAVTIKEAGIWRSMASVFVPVEDSDMSEYPYAVDIPFAYIKFYLDKEKSKNENNKLPEIKLSFSCEPIIKEIKSPNQIFEMALNFFDTGTIELQENMYAIFLNTSLNVIGWYHVSKGGINSCFINTRLIMAAAIGCNAYSIILVHNHPSGNVNPSENDKKVTEHFKKACYIFDIKFSDHVIISKETFYSFTENGIL